jgi:hypothetical protein
VQARAQIADRQEGLAEGIPGFYLQFEIPVDHQTALDSLEGTSNNDDFVVGDLAAVA